MKVIAIAVKRTSVTVEIFLKSAEGSCDSVHVNICNESHEIAHWKQNNMRDLFCEERRGSFLNVTILSDNQTDEILREAWTEITGLKNGLTLKE